VAVRALPAAGNVAGAMGVLPTVKIYPLASAANPRRCIVSSMRSQQAAFNKSWKPGDFEDITSIGRALQ
jgi:hypothetical protein